MSTDAMPDQKSADRSEVSGFKSTLLADVAAVCEQFGRGVTTDEYQQHGDYHVTTVSAHFGVAEAVALAGYTPVREQGGADEPEASDESEPYYVDQDACREMRQAAKREAFAAWVADRFDWAAPTVRTHAYGHCSHEIDEDPADPGWRGGVPKKGSGA